MLVLPGLNDFQLLLFVFLEFRLALIQLAVSANKTDNINRATDLISKAAKQGAQLLILPVKTCYLMLVDIRPVLVTVLR